MKKYITTIIAMSLLSMASIAQDSSAYTNSSFYIGTGVSISNGNDFKRNNYPSIEAGLVYDNIGMSIVGGKKDFMFGSGVTSDYFYEGKVMGFHTKNRLTLIALFGIGNYVKSNYVFIEYGAGLSVSVSNRISLGMSYSNWDGMNFVTPNVSFNF